MSYSVPQTAAGGRPSSPSGCNGRIGTNGSLSGPTAKTVPAITTHMRHMPRVTLNPTSRVASVGAAHPVPAGSTSSPTSARTPPPLPSTSGNTAAGADQAAVDAVHVAYVKTEAHLKAIEEKLAKLHEEMKQQHLHATTAPLAAAAVVTQTPSPPPPPPPHFLPESLSNNASATCGDLASTGGPARSGFRRASPISGSPEAGRSAGANHHLEPIHQQQQKQPELMGRLQRNSGGGSAQAARAASPPAAAAAAVKPPAKASPPLPAPTAAAAAAAAAVAAPAAASANGAGRPRLSIEESNAVDTPDMSSGSDGSDSSDDDRPDGIGYLPAAAQLSFVKPKPPPAPTVEPVGPSLMTNAAARKEGAAMRQGIGFKKPAVSAAAPPAGDAGRRGIKLSFDGGSNSITPFSAPASASGTQPSAFNSSPRDTVDRPASESGKVFAVGRQRRRASLEVSLSGIPVPDDSSAADNARAADGMSVTTRRQSSAIKHVREHFFAPIPRFSDVLPHTEEGIYDKHDVEKILLAGAPCSWLCCAALAISFVSGVPTPIEKVLRANHMAVHFISLPTVTFAELYDITNDYIHSRFHRTMTYNKHCAEDEFDDDEEAAQHLSEEELRELPNIHCESAMFDVTVMDPESEDNVNGMGEHAPITSLANFRKELMQHLSEEKSTYIFNFDPYVLEQAQLRLRSNMCDTEEEIAEVMQSARYVPKSFGHFCILLSFDPVKHTATILTPHLSKEQYPLNFPEEEDAEDEEAVAEAAKSRRFESAFANVVLEQQTVSLQVLYESVNQLDPYTTLSRGFMRVFTSSTFAPKVPSIFPLFVLDGSSAGGLMTSVLDVKIAPHVLGLAMLHHLSVTFLLSDNARRKQSSRNLLSKANVCDVKLRGIPLTKICQQLRLPVSMIVANSDKASIATAYVWYHLLLQQLQINQDVRIGLILPARREGASDGQPNITDTEFLEHLRLAVKSQSVMLISFDVNIVLNLRVDSRKEPAHFGLVIGLDEERGLVRLADVNVKRFRKTWHVTINRLYNAVMGYGYIVASKDNKVIKSLNGKAFQDEVLQRASYFLPPPVPMDYQRFEYPMKPYPVTVLADAVERLGFSGTNVERFLNFSGFHISYFLSHDMPLEGAAFVIFNYSHYALDDALRVTTTHYDFYDGNLPPAIADKEEEKTGGRAVGSRASDYKVRTEEDLLQAIQYVLAAPTKRKLIVKYDSDIVSCDPAVWNGSSGSSFAFVMDYEAATRMVVLSDANPSSFYRTLACPLSVLFGAVCSWDRIDLRARGTILLTTEASQESDFENVKGYDMAHALVHHPFKPIFSAACACLALAATEMMMNIETPTLLGGAPLSFAEGEKRKYKRYNNIFSAEDFLYALPSFSVHDWRTQPVDSQDVVSIANNAFTTLRLPLRAVDVLKGDSGARSDPLALLRACSGVSGLLTITLVAYDTGVLYGVPGTSVGVINRVHVIGEDDEEDDGDAHRVPLVVPNAPANSVGSVQLLEGDPCRWGASVECSAEELLRATVGIFLVEEVEGEEEDDA